MKNALTKTIFFRAKNLKDFKSRLKKNFFIPLILKIFISYYFHT
jgi:hypothetical protein